MRGICCCWLMLIFWTIFVSCHSFLFWIRSELRADRVDFARAVAWALHFCDLRAADGLQVVERGLCSLCWSRGVAVVVFGVGFLLVEVFGCQYGSFVLGVWTCGPLWWRAFLLSGGCVSWSYCCRGWLLFWSLLWWFWGVWPLLGGGLCIRRVGWFVFLDGRCGLVSECCRGRRVLHRELWRWFLVAGGREWVLRCSLFAFRCSGVAWVGLAWFVFNSLWI